MFMGCKASACVVSMHQVALASFHCHNAVHSHAWRYALPEQLTHGYDTQTSYIAKLSACFGSCSCVFWFISAYLSSFGSVFEMLRSSTSRAKYDLKMIQQIYDRTGHVCTPTQSTGKLDSNVHFSGFGCRSVS